MIKDKKNFLRTVFSSQIALTVLGFIIVVGISIPLAKNVSKQYRIGKEIKELEDEITYLENNNSELQQLVKYLESDQFALEQARSNLNYKQPGEEVVVIKNDDDREGENPAAIAAGGTKNASIEAKSNPGRWWNYFFK